MENANWVVSRFEFNPSNKQVAFAVNSETFTIIVSSSGHPTIVRYLGDGFDCGGWLWLDKSKLIHSSGFLGPVPDRIYNDVAAALSNYFRIEFRDMR